MTMQVRESVLDLPREPSNAIYTQKRALRFVLSLGLTVLIVVLVCGLIWWLGNDGSFDMLGRYIIIAGIIFVVFGVIIIINRNQLIGSKNSIGQFEEKHMQAGKHRNPMGTVGKGTRLIMYFCGVGLLCLFIGNMIILGL
jgi:magnesium-transporting ATPase (P-type)